MRRYLFASIISVLACASAHADCYKMIPDSSPMVDDPTGFLHACVKDCLQNITGYCPVMSDFDPRQAPAAQRVAFCSCLAGALLTATILSKRTVPGNAEVKKAVYRLGSAGVLGCSPAFMTIVPPDFLPK
jgi:hypothetical protein